MKKEKVNFNFSLGSSYRLIFLAVIFLAIGILLGIFFQYQISNSRLQKAQGVIKILNSEVVPSIISYGKVTNIDGKKITLAFNQDLITITIKDDALIRILSDSTAKNADSAKSEINQIKVGDMLNVKTSVDSTGNFEGEEVIDFSQK
jgi:preprotein translocase subunit YajC